MHSCGVQFVERMSEPVFQVAETGGHRARILEAPFCVRFNGEESEPCVTVCFLS